MESSYKLFSADTALFGSNGDFIEDMYEKYLNDPSSVDLRWSNYFSGFKQIADTVQDIPHSPIRELFRDMGRSSSCSQHIQTCFNSADKQGAVLRYINAHRVRGHQYADLDPLNLREKAVIPDLDPAFHGLTAADFKRTFHTGSLVTEDELTLQEIHEFIRKVYMGTIGSEYMYLTSTEQKRWIQARLEGRQARLQTNAEEQRWILRMLTAAEGIEQYLHRKYVGQKRFSLEGGEGLIPLLDDLIQQSGARGVKEIVIGMAHRGRLNVLVNILGKRPSKLFEEFEGKHVDERTGSGDVKYHQGFSSDVETPGGVVHLTLGFNPSHLEIINPVVVGSVRARQGRREDHEGKEVLPVLIHG
ncbi:MAG: 2-oxoglutarate dehydrogenase E1 component, partial [Gammaproteobacteria bacterium]